MKKIGIFLLVIMCLFITACGKKEVKEDKKEEVNTNIQIKEEHQPITYSRPYGVVINNYPSAVKVQSGLDKAFVIYDFPIEGNLSRSVAFFRDIEDVKLGTIRSARHNYIDYVQEYDAILVHFGWSAVAKKELISSKYDHIDGNSSDRAPFVRERYEGLATEHTVYTNLSKIIDYSKNTKKLKTTTVVEAPIKYSNLEVELKERENSQIANIIDIYYSSSYYFTFKYNNVTKRYERFFKGNAHKDYFTKKQYDCKNIIIEFITWGTVSDHKDSAGNSYLDLNNTGTGEGYYITNGYAVPITWQKDTRSSQTIYRYIDGTDLKINNGNTWVMMTSKSKKYSIK